ncbi:MULTISPECIES: hypothetical protein [unclassified Pseudoalteromonas]|uniref:hypothetical protein n=1 Tax=unclassified Pseudoalteromonas TaxID=194690 RepID=UPI000C7C0806|nr:MULTISPECIES: hypothetical protein [unclassified Pseudoalteromonas]AUJ70945.1 hypothetical protein PNC201_13425 [Pseudoalteromonas sp. NC201]MBR8843977.1 hypothetical protein [Pseudoalteromonas sp. JC3]WJE08025.1 hypothetical protein QSH61_14195 [Pseudoalteromonas sp. JC3]
MSFVWREFFDNMELPFLGNLKDEIMKLVLLVLPLTLIGCTSSNNVQLVEKHAEMAVVECGKGNVKSVSTTSFTCKEKA